MESIADGLSESGVVRLGFSVGVGDAVGVGVGVALDSGVGVGIDVALGTGRDRSEGLWLHDGLSSTLRGGVGSMAGRAVGTTDVGVGPPERALARAALGLAVGESVGVTSG